MFLHLLMQLVISQARKAASGKLVPGLQSLETNDALFFGASWRHVFNWEKGHCNGRKKLWGHRLVGFSSSKHNIRNLLNMCLLKIFECVEYAVEPQASLRSQTNANNTHGPCVPCVPCRSGSPLVQSASPFQSLPVLTPSASWIETSRDDKRPRCFHRGRFLPCEMLLSELGCHGSQGLD